MVDFFSLLDEIFKLISSVRQILLPIGIFLVIGGLLFAFFGRKIFDFLLFLIGGSLVAGAVIIFIGPRAGLPETITLGFVGFVAGGILTYYIFYLLIFGIGASVGTLMGILIMQGDVSNFWAGIVVLAIASIFGAIAVMIFQITLAISTAITGAYIVSIGMFILTGNSGLATTFGTISAFAGAFFQIFLLETFAESFEKAIGSTFDGLVLQLPFGKRAKRKTKVKPRPKPKEIIKEFSIEGKEREFADIEERRRNLQMSQHKFESVAVNILESFKKFIEACENELANLTKGKEGEKRTKKAGVIKQKREQAIQVLSKLENILEEWRKKTSQSYIT